MTTKEVIEELKYIKDSLVSCSLSYEALDIAIETIEENEKLAEDLQTCLDMYKKLLNKQFGYHDSITCDERLPEKKKKRTWKEGEYFIYTNVDCFEIGKIKRVCKDGVFAYYSSGDTASKTPFYCMNKLINDYTIIKTNLGGEKA